MTFCGFCHAQLNGDPQPRPELCAKCYRVFEALDKQTDNIKRHMMAFALVRSNRDASRRLGCPTTAHSSALGNATVRTTFHRAALQRAAMWALKAGVYTKPPGFEDVSLPGENGSPSGEVKVSKQEPRPTEAKSKPTEAKRKPITPETVAEVIEKRNDGASVEELAEEYGVQPWTIETVTQGEVEPEPVKEPVKEPALSVDPGSEIPGTIEEFVSAPAPMREALHQPNTVSVTLRNDCAPADTDPALEALYRLACPSDERQASRDLVTVAYELGRARGGLDAFNNE